MGSIIPNVPSIPNTEADSWTPLVELNAQSYYGLNKVSLTAWDETTTLPQIAQGSLIDIDGSLAEFIADEAITGAPNDGTVYISFTVVGSVVTPALTNTAPTWYADKGGWYDDLGNRYSGHVMTKTGASYTLKALLSSSNNGLDNIEYSSGGTRISWPEYSGAFGPIRSKSHTGSSGTFYYPISEIGLLVVTNISVRDNVTSESGATIEQLIDGSWVEVARAWFTGTGSGSILTQNYSGMFYSNGSNLRCALTQGAASYTETVSYSVMGQLT